MVPSLMVVGLRASQLRVIVSVSAIVGLMAVGCGDSTSDTQQGPTPDSAEEASLEEIDVVAAALTLEEMPDGSVALDGSLVTQEDLGEQTSEATFAKAWGFLRSYAASFTRPDGVLTWKYTTTVTLYDSLEGAKQSMDERESFLLESFGANPEITAVNLSQLLVVPIADQSAARRLEITYEDGVTIENQLAFRRNKVVGVVTIATPEGREGLGLLSTMARRLDNRIQANIEE